MPDAKPRILHVLKSSVYAGAENVVIRIMKSLEDRYDMAYAATDGEIRAVLEREQIRSFLLKEFSEKDIRQVVETFRPDVIHAHDFSASVVCARVKGRAKLISHLHYDPPWTARWNARTLAYAWYAGKMDRILSVSGQSFRHMVFADRLKDKCTVVGNPIDTERIRAMAKQGASAPSCDLLFAGRLVRQKNPQRFIRIVSLLKQRGLDLTCIMLGEGELRDECLELIRETGLEAQVAMPGFQPNPYPYMKQARLLCMTSDWEGYGLVVLEANALGTPAIAAVTSGTGEVLGAGAEELCGTEEEFADKIQSLLQDDAVYAAWKLRAKQRAEQIIQPSSYAERMDAIYQELL